MTQNEDLPPPKADFSAPPPYELTQQTNVDGQQPQHTEQQQQIPTQTTVIMDTADSGDRDSNCPNSPIVVVDSLSPSSKLPTYEEVQIEKSLLGEMPPSLMTHNILPIHGRMPPPAHPVLISAIRNASAAGHHQVGGQPGVGVGPNGALTFIAIDTSDGHHSSRGRVGPGGLSSASVADNSLLGTDLMFVTAFLVAFLFNWIGFLMLTCFFHTIAARYGALSGFGLSLAKWTLIVKHSTDLASHENSWLWWLIMAFGFLICVRALVQYVSIKRTWRLLSASAQERLLFFY